MALDRLPTFFGAVPTRRVVLQTQTMVTTQLALEYLLLISSRSAIVCI